MQKRKGNARVQCMVSSLAQIKEANTMKKEMTEKEESLRLQHESNLTNIEGTFAAEGIALSSASRKNIERIASGKADYRQVLNELREKYKKRA